MANRKRITVALVGLLVLVLGGWLVQKAVSSDGSHAASPAVISSEAISSQPTAGVRTGDRVPGAESGLAVRPLSSLPAEAADTWKLIRVGGPYPYPSKDNSVFGNREQRLPLKASGYYHEYTVKTPGSPDRGARRLVTGQAQELYYTGDHYSTFVLVNPDQ